MNKKIFSKKFKAPSKIKSIGEKMKEIIKSPFEDFKKSRKFAMDYKRSNYKSDLKIELCIELRDDDFSKWRLYNQIPCSTELMALLKEHNQYSEKTFDYSNGVADILEIKKEYIMSHVYCMALGVIRNHNVKVLKELGDILGVISYDHFGGKDRHNVRSTYWFLQHYDKFAGTYGY